MQDLKLIYDVSEKTLRLGTIMFPLIFMLIGIAIFFCHKKVVDKTAKSHFGINKRKFEMFFGILFASFAALISALIISFQIAEYRQTKCTFSNKEYITIEGQVKNYHPMSAGEHNTERFTVGNVQFEYSD